MTAVPDWDIVGPAGTDAELARAAAAGDRAAFAGIYDRYADRLHDFCVGMLRDRDGAADCVQDAFCTAAARLAQLREPDKLRAWLYAIARNEALRRLRDCRRETPSDELPDTASDEPGPDTMAARTDLADLIAEAAGGLSDRDRSVLELAYRHGLDGPELADALAVTPATANKMVYRLRETIERSLGALLVSRRARNAGDGCAELAAILDGWDGQFTVLIRKRIARHIESCPTCDEQRRRLVSPAALLGGAPVFIPAPAGLRDRTLSEIQLTCSATLLETDATGPDAESPAADTAAPIPGEPADDADDHRRRRWALVIALFAATLIASLGLTIAWLYQPSTDIVPTDVSGISTTPDAPLTPMLSNPPPAPPTPPEPSAIAVPPDPGPPPMQTPAFTAPPPTLEPNPPEYGPPIPPLPPPTESSATPTQRSSEANESSPRLTPRTRTPTRSAITPRETADAPNQTAPRRSRGYDNPSR